MAPCVSLKDIDSLRDAIESTGMIDAMPDSFYEELMDNGIETVEQFEDSYQGQYRDGAEFSEELCESIGYLNETNLPAFLQFCIDWEAVWMSSLRFDYFIIEGKRAGDNRFFSSNY